MLNQKKVRMVVTDLDGTLLSPDRTISKEAVAAIAKLRDKGIRFTFVTGRPPYAVERFAAQVDITAPIITCNGAMTVAEGIVRVNKNAQISIEPLKALLENAQKNGLTVLILTEEAEYALSETSWTEERKRAKRPYPIVSLSQIAEEKRAVYKLNIMAGEKEEEFARLIPDIRAFEMEYAMSFYGITGCEIVAKGIDKRTALKELCFECNLDIQTVLAVGDNANDLGMLRSAGIGAAVANATMEAKEAADYVCRHPFSEGVVEAIKQFTD